MKTLTILAAAAALVVAAPATPAHAGPLPHCYGWTAWAQRPHDVRLDATIRSARKLTCRHAARIVETFLMTQIAQEECADAAAAPEGSCVIRHGYVCEKHNLRRATCQRGAHVVTFRELDTDLG